MNQLTTLNHVYSAHFFLFLTCPRASDPPLFFVDLKSLTRSFCSFFFFLLLPPHPLPHLSSSLLPRFFFFSLSPPSCHSCRWWEALFHRAFYTRETAAWLLADVDKGWGCGCQAIQIISGIKRSIASFSKSCLPLPRPLFNPSLFFPTDRMRVLGEIRWNLSAAFYFFSFVCIYIFFLAFIWDKDVSSSIYWGCCCCCCSQDQSYNCVCGVRVLVYILWKLNLKGPLCNI